uniref:Uncharacterized protein n=1 Tax=Romanomermis culicivorax TaxID=13658 RepID=A0A915HI76_ROMCU
MDHTAARLINCICSKSEDCHTNSSWEQKMSKCIFVVENGVEFCKADFGEAVIFRPSQKSKPSPMTCFQTQRNCNKSDIQECIDDCELKKWSNWSICTLEASDNLYYRKRQRMENNQSLGQFSNQSCRKWDREACPTTTAPTRLMVHIIDVSTSPPAELGNIYVLVVVGCIAAIILVIFIIICILIHKKRGGTTKLAPVLKFIPKNATPSSSWTNPTPSSAVGSVGLDYFDQATLKSGKKSTRSQRKLSLPARSRDLNPKYQPKSTAISDRFLF